MVVTLGQQYDVGEKPTVIYIASFIGQLTYVVKVRLLLLSL